MIWATSNFFVLTTFIAFFIVGVIYPSLFYLQLGVKQAATSYIDNWWNCKISYARVIDKPKILVVSGSNSLFSISAYQMEKELNIPTVNFGVHAGLGLKYLLDRTKNELKYGDIVLLPLEYQLYKEVETFGGEHNDYICAYDAEYFNNMPSIQKVKFVYTSSFNSIRHGIEHRLGKKRNFTGYSDMTMNKNGDIIGNIYVKRKLEQVNSFKIDITGKDSYLNDAVAEYLKDFVNFCNMNNIKLIVTYPATYMDNGKFSDGDIVVLEKIEKFWKDQDGVIILNSYQDNLYAKDDFYDGNYHMNDVGRAKRTKQIIKDLSEYLWYIC